MAEQDLDRNDDATPHKLQKAREKGQVSKSPDVVSAVVFIAAVTYLSWQGWDMVHTQFRLDQLLVVQSASATSGSQVIWPLVQGVIQQTLFLLMPFACVVMLAAIIGNVMQTGPILSMDPVIADVERLNPANGVKRLFSMRALFDAGRASAKLLLLSTVAYLSLRDLAPQFYSLSGLSASGYVKTLIDDLSGLGFKMGLLLIIIAAIDWGFIHAYQPSTPCKKF
ncbi:MAG: hypothetical protein EOP24_32500 [Hyphomicrobiales bacterium]|nr:MAG: hypothetical protein EOP24_32500 [Hyphomicrobiales bacterium]